MNIRRPRRNRTKTDDEALVLISLADGLLVLDGETATEPTWGEISINPTAESVTLYLSQFAAAELCPASNCRYGIRKSVDGDAVPVVEGTAAIVSTVVRKTA